MISKELTVERFEGAAGDQRILLLRGPITIETAPKFERAVHHESAETMILDLSEVPYIDSVGLGSLVATNVSHQKTGRCLVLTGLKPRVLKVMEITKVGNFFMTFATTWEAVEALANTGSA
jgi:anti-sigma B factor antagonist